jgi:hypothetical protein
MLNVVIAVIVTLVTSELIKDTKVETIVKEASSKIKDCFK